MTPAKRKWKPKISGSPRNRWGKYETVALAFSWKSYAIVAAGVVLPLVGADLTEHVIPTLKEQGGWLATLGGILGVLVRVLGLLMANNSAKSINKP